MELEAKRPVIKFPDNFEISISTNELGLNITEIIYYVSIQIFNIARVFILPNLNFIL